MTFSSNYYLLIFVISIIITGILTPIARGFALKKKLLDFPLSTHKSHTLPIPYLGGVAIMFGSVIISYVGIVLSPLSSSYLWLASSVFIPAILLGVVGLVDDLKDLKPFPRLAIQSITGFAISIFLVFTDTVGNPTNFKILDILITIFWIVGITNSINFFDNIDGGAAGTTFVSATALFIISSRSNQYLIAALSVVLAGSLLGFLIWNKSPARIYMGDSGALFLGVLIAILTIRLEPKSANTIISFSVPILILAVPILDTSVAVISRLRRGISPFQGGKDHLSHRLVRLGLSRKQSVVILWFASAIFAFFALVLSDNYSNYQFYVLIIAIIIWIFLFCIFTATQDS
jgi:UDP-GlcNAc:undecaprenyl-phosphate GlcNAc-1-phosphate transferase